MASYPESTEELKEKLQSLLQEIEHLRQENRLLKDKLGMEEEISPNVKKPGNTMPEIEMDVITSITQSSSPEEKIKLFRSLFKGRNDVFANRWENKKGRSGYSPACHNEWKPGICAKPKIKCSECPQQQFKTFDENAIEAHLRGKVVVGVYPLYPDDTCYFLAIDFDGDGWQKDILAVNNTCNTFDIHVAMERSRSGNGAHAWFFFTKEIEAILARKFGAALLTYSMDQRHELSFKSYDRLFPNQDTMPKGGFGNLIALPLQQAARQKDNSVFIDENFIPYPDQWSFLNTVKKLSKEEIIALTAKLCKGNELGTLKEDEEEIKPWERKTTKNKARLTKHDFPDMINLVKADMLYIPKKNISQKGLNVLKRLAAFNNPQFYKAQAMRLPVYNKPRVISCSEETNEYLCLPRGCEEDMIHLVKELDQPIEFLDKRNKGRIIEVEFKGKLRTEQQQALDALLQYENGVLSAPPAFGKTVMAAKIIAERKTNTLILVHRQQLLSQWESRLKDFLELKDNAIGRLGGGKNTLTGIIDIAIMQSLNYRGTVKDCVKDYGMVIIDECHHIPAFSFEQILKQVNAKYVYGLTATPSRQDGHHPIIFMHCGPVRYKVNAGRQAAQRPFEHVVIPRFTGLYAGANMNVNQYGAEKKELTIQELYAKIVSDEMRNRFIADDVVRNYEKGRNALILTERTAHVKILEEMLQENIPDILTLTGGRTAKATNMLFERIENMRVGKQITFIATGKYIGEGFDEARLDTLFLAMPISWKGTIQQYTGRLHRLHDGKKEVQVYDYVDIHVKMLEKMYTKRLNGYASIGYKVKAENMSDAPANIIFNKDNFLPVYSQDILNAQKEIVIVSPFVAHKRTEQMLSLLQAALNKKIKVIIMVRPAEDFRNVIVHAAIFEQLKNKGLQLIFQSGIHQKFAVIDQRISWYGSINLLSYGSSQESMMRIESGHIAGELLRSMMM